MKRAIFTLLLAIGTTIAFSQNIHFGVKAGLNVSNLTGNIFHDNKSLTGFNAGVIADIPLHNFSLQPGVFFSTKGNKLEDNMINGDGNDAGTVTSRLKLNYIEVPVNLLYHVIAAQQVSVYFGGGPYLGYGIGGSFNSNGRSFPINFKNESNPEVISYKNPDIGVNLVAGVLLNKRLMIDAGYGLGITSISSGAATIQNRVIHVSLGYFFN